MSDFIIMGRNCDLTASEKSVIISELAKDKSTLEISKMIGRYHQTAKRFIAAPTKGYVRGQIRVT